MYRETVSKNIPASSISPAITMKTLVCLMLLSVLAVGGSYCHKMEFVNLRRWLRHDARARAYVDCHAFEAYLGTECASLLSSLQNVTAESAASEIPQLALTTEQLETACNECCTRAVEVLSSQSSSTSSTAPTCASIHDTV